MIIKFPKEKKERIIPLIQDYFAQERHEEIGNLESEFMLDFFISKIGPFIYNQALYDAQAYLHRKMDDVEAGLYELEQPMPPR